MEKAKLQTSANFPGLVLSSVKDDAESYQKGTYIISALIAMALWVLINGWSMHQVYHRIGMMQAILNTFTVDPEYTFQDLKEDEKLLWKPTEESGGFLGLFGGSEDKAKVSPFVQVVLASLATLFALVIFLTLACRIVRSGANFWDAVATVAVFTVPLAIGTLLSFGLFSWADSCSGEDLPSILYMVAIVIMAVSAMTSLIVLHADVLWLLKIREIKRYFTTVLSMLLAIGTFGAVSRWLIS